MSAASERFVSELDRAVLLEEVIALAHFLEERMMNGDHDALNKIFERGGSYFDGRDGVALMHSLRKKLDEYHAWENEPHSQGGDL